MHKKLRERALIEQFLSLCPDFEGYSFERYSENPDIIYKKNTHELGFDSVIIAEDQDVIDCHFDALSCKLRIHSLTAGQELLDKAAELLTHNLFKHIRQYHIPTILVFSVLNPDIDIQKLSQHFRLPALSSRNMEGYYLANKKSFVRVALTV